ncbi:MAG: hypothetical protein QOG88_1976, partial [Actinomycetota bacterium]|nr:hypothetical protein [Actinomycetota bacterium]
PGVSTLGMDEPQMREIASIIGTALKNPDDTGVKQKARAQVRELMERYPVYA